MRRLVVLVAVSCLVVAGCGGAENEPNLAEAIERTEAQRTARFAMDAVAGPNDGSSAASCTGEADYEAKRMHWSCESADIGKFEVIEAEGELYLRGDVGSSLVPLGQWIRLPEGSDDDGVASLSPERLLAMLRAASEETERVGEEDVRGEPTVRYRLTVDCERAELDCETTAPVDVWIDDDGVVRRVALDDDSAEAKIEFFDFGAELRIVLPAAEEVMDPADFDAVPCRGGGAPIDEQRLAAALRRAGLDPSNEGECFGSLVATIAATRDGTPTFVTCGVLATPPPGAPTRVAKSASGQRANLRLANVTCDLFSDAAALQQSLMRLDRTFDELERAIRP